MNEKEILDSVGDGWHKIIKELLLDFSAIYYVTNIRIKASQVKEKWGGLRFYYFLDYPKAPNVPIDRWASIIDNLVSYTEAISYHICEVCGKHGKLRSDLSWQRTLCEKHYEEAVNV